MWVFWYTCMHTQSDREEGKVGNEDTNPLGDLHDHAHDRPPWVVNFG